MTIEQNFVLVGGLGMIVFIWWFFFGKKEKTSIVKNNTIKIIIAGGYKPSIIKLNNGITTTLLLKRTEANSCLEEIVFPDFKIKEYLPVNQEISIKITPNKTGEFKFHCGMNMYQGKIIVV